MTTIKEVQNAVKHFSHKELVRFSQWFTHYEEDAWDKQIKEDAVSGKLDHLAEKALKHFKAGHCKEL